MIYPAPKQPLTIRISVTDRCQLRCRYCMPAEGVSPCDHQDILRFEEIASIVEQIQGSFDVRKVRLTGGEPLARKGIVQLVSMLANMTIPDLAMTTNAQRLEDMALDLSAAGIHRINISLDTLNPDTFRYLTRGGSLDRTLKGIEAALHAKLQPVKLNVVVMKGINDHEVCDLLSFALDRNCEIRFLELMPIGYGAKLYDDGFVSTASVLQALSETFVITPLVRAAGSSARRHNVQRQDGTQGVVGFISPCSNSFCSDCTRLRITADGRMIGCLARKDGSDIRPFLQSDNGNSLADAVHQALLCKRSDQQFEQPTLMATIGG